MAPTSQPHYESGLVPAKLGMRDNAIVFELRAYLCSKVELDPPNSVCRLDVPFWALQSQEKFEEAINKIAAHTFSGYEWRYKQTKAPIDKDHLQYSVHAQEPWGSPCLRVLQLRDFLKDGEYEVTNKKAFPRGFFKVHVYGAEGGDIEPTSSGMSSRGPIQSATDANGPDRRVDSRAGDQVETSCHVEVADQSPASVHQIVPNASETTPAPTDAATGMTQADQQGNAQDHTDTASSSAVEQENLPLLVNQVTQIMAQAPRSPANADQSTTPGQPRPPTLGSNDVIYETASPENQQDGDDTVMGDVNDEDEEEVTAADGPRFIRLGTLKLDLNENEINSIGKENTDDEVPMEIVVIADIMEDPEFITYYEICSWNINGTATADYHNRSHVDQEAMRHRLFNPDVLFIDAYSKGTLEEAVKEAAGLIANGTHSPDEVAAPRWPLTSDAPTFRPNARHRQQVKRKNPAEDDSEIPVVMAVMKKCQRHAGPNEWTTYVQGWLYFEDGFDEAHDWATDAVQMNGGITLKQALEGDRGKNWSTELWVLPQTYQSDAWAQVETYRWEKRSRLVARDWLDSRVWKAGAGCLYLELHIVDRPAVSS